MIIIRKNIKLISISLFPLILLSLSGFVLASRDLEIYTDPLDDLRLFEQEQFEDIDLDPSEDQDDFLEAFDEEVWELGDPTTGPDHIDITEIYIDIGDVNSKFVIKVQDTNTDLEDEDILIFIWNDCSNGDGCNMQLIGILSEFVAPGYDEDINIYYGEGCNGENVTGEIETGPGKFEMEFPTDWLGDDEDCDLWVMLVTIYDDSDDDNYIYSIDICPNNSVGDPSFTLWDLLLLIIFLATYIALVFIARTGGKGR